MALSRRTGRSRFTLVLLILTSITVLTLDFRGSSALRSLRDMASTVFSPVRDAASSAFSPFTNAWNGLWNYGEVEAENDRLRAEIDRYKGEAAVNAEAAEALKDLTEAQGITQFTSLPAVDAQVIAGPATNFEHTIEVDRGSDQGIQVGMPVVGGAGLVGRVSEVYPGRSVVRLVNDPGVVVSVRLVSTGTTALLRGQGDGKPLVVDAGVDPKVVVAPDELVTTSGEDRALFPGGIPVGNVSEVHLGTGQQTQVLTVIPSVDLARLRFLKVLLWIPPP